ncbi:glycosyltransferase family 2 protein [Pinibacter soli]|uniref:Glycosyltransferase n=1 Tax=Pinibacter soli TaxID=3044211 RepID=A0ABT6RGV1_9BACT|nr:glycosyltransferase [Pinibacter soli]MDI3321651.1 glycosyltransferase [Pinibacter soli]
MHYRFSIILPVRNGGEYVKECAKSILSQTYSDFNFIVLDNCSTDGTAEWLESLNDPRIVIYRSDKSLSIEENWARAVAVPKNEYITLIGHDDVLESNYLEVMNKLISKYPGASLFQTHFNLIDSQSKVIRSARPMQAVENAESFLTSIMTKKFDIVGTGFLMRSADYDKLGGIPDYPGLLFADYELWLNLTRLGYKVTAEENCFSFRIHQSATTTSSDKKIQDAFERFVKYLEDVQASGAEYAKVIAENGEAFLLSECKAMCHRLLRTPRQNGGSELSVKNTIETFVGYAKRLIPRKSFDPMREQSIKLAAMIDRSTLGRSLFLMFKKMYRKPVLK